MVRRGANFLLAAGALSMSALLPGCQMPTWTQTQPVACESCQLPCSWLHPCGFNRCVDDRLAMCAARYDALKALDYAPECLASNGDYRDGFVDAFQDVARGHRGDLPAVPPDRYWNGCFRTGPAAQLAQDWFAGYVDGAEQARACYGLNQVQVSAAGYPPSLNSQHGPQHGHPAPGMWNPTMPTGPHMYGQPTGQTVQGNCPTCQGGHSW